MTIKGKMTYQNLGTGFWGIIGDDGKNWQILGTPMAMQKEGMRITVIAEELKSQESIFMWGTTINILDFQVDK